MRYRRCPKCGHVAPESSFKRPPSGWERYPVRRCPNCNAHPPRGRGLGAFPFAKKPTAADADESRYS